MEADNNTVAKATEDSSSSMASNKGLSLQSLHTHRSSLTSKFSYGSQAPAYGQAGAYGEQQGQQGQ